MTVAYADSCLFVFWPVRPRALQARRARENSENKKTCLYIVPSFARLKRLSIWNLPPFTLEAKTHRTGSRSVQNGQDQCRMKMHQHSRDTEIDRERRKIGCLATKPKTREDRHANCQGGHVASAPTGCASLAIWKTLAELLVVEPRQDPVDF